MPELISPNQTIILTSAYLAPISYYKQMAGSKEVIIEQHDHYVRQTYRNRCRIASANGVIDLSIPVRKSAPKCKMKDIRIVYSDNWQQIHWRAIESAYNSSPFFEYYRDYFEPFFLTKTEFLIDLNNGLQTKILDLIDISIPITFTDEYKYPDDETVSDLRDFFHPKKDYPGYLKPYYQVFQQKFGFQRDLSVLDLIFNMGNESVLYFQYNPFPQLLR